MKLPAPIETSQDTCTPATCRKQCALEVVDGLLRETGGVCGEEVDALLDLRWLLRHRQDAEATLALFCRLRRAMEERHYLAFYRLRRWLENQVAAVVRPHRGAAERPVALRLEFYCLEAIRHRTLQGALNPGEPRLSPRVRFVFRPAADSPAPPLSSCPVS